MTTEQDRRFLEEIGHYSLEQIDMSNRARLCLASAGFHKMADVMWRSDAELLAIPGFGRGSLDDIRNSVREFIETQMAEASLIPTDIWERARSIASDFLRDYGMFSTADIVPFHRLSLAIAEALAAERGRSGND